MKTFDLRSQTVRVAQDLDETSQNNLCRENDSSCGIAQGTEGYFKELTHFRVRPSIASNRMRLCCDIHSTGLRLAVASALCRSASATHFLGQSPCRPWCWITSAGLREWKSCSQRGDRNDGYWDHYCIPAVPYTRNSVRKLNATRNAPELYLRLNGASRYTDSAEVCHLQSP